MDHHTLPSREAAIAAYRRLYGSAPPWWMGAGLADCGCLPTEQMVEGFLTLPSKASWLWAMEEEVRGYFHHARVPVSATRKFFQRAFQACRCDQIEALYAAGLRPSPKDLESFCHYYKPSLDPVLDLLFGCIPKLEPFFGLAITDGQLLDKLLPYVGDQLFSRPFLKELDVPRLTLFREHGADLDSPDLLRELLIEDYNRAGASRSNKVFRYLGECCDATENPELVQLAEITHRHWWMFIADKPTRQTALAAAFTPPRLKMFLETQRGSTPRSDERATKRVLAMDLSLEMRLFFLFKMTPSKDLRKAVQQCKKRASREERDWAETHIVPIACERILKLWR